MWSLTLGQACALEFPPASSLSPVLAAYLGMFDRPCVVGHVVVLEVDRQLLRTIDPALDQQLERGLEPPSTTQKRLLDAGRLLTDLRNADCETVRMRSRPQVRTIFGAEAGFGQSSSHSIQVGDPLNPERVDLLGSEMSVSLVPELTESRGIECRVNWEQVEPDFERVIVDIEGVRHPAGRRPSNQTVKVTSNLQETILIPCTEQKAFQTLMFLTWDLPES